MGHSYESDSKIAVDSIESKYCFL